MKNKIRMIAVYCLYRLFTLTWRIRHIVHPETQKLINQKHPLLLGHWHGDELGLIHIVRRYKLATITSPSRDGAVAEFLITRHGGSVTRGSSSRGGSHALRGLLRACRSGQITSIAVDGPKGPIYVPKPGIFEVSKLCDAPIVPVGVSTSNSYVFQKSWNKTHLPLPFSKVLVYFGAPLPAVTKNEDPKSHELRDRLTTEINAATQLAANLIAT